MVTALRSGDRNWRETIEAEEENMDIISSSVVRFLTTLGGNISPRSRPANQ